MGVTLQFSWVKEKEQREEKCRSENIPACLISSVSRLTAACITGNKQTTSKANGLLYGRTLSRSAVSVGAASDLDTNGLRWNSTTDAAASYTI